MTLAISTTARSTSDYRFEPVRHDPNKMQIVSDVFKRILAPIYGSQEEALEKIRRADNRTCRLFYEGDSPKGLLVYKDKLNDECVPLGGASKSLEIKTLLVLDPAQNSRRGIGSQLLSRVEDKAREAKAQAVHVTVSETKPESLAFFKKHSFQVIQACPNRYSNGVTEYVLQKLLSSSDSVPPQILQPALPAVASNPVPLPRRTYRDVTLKHPYVELIANGTKTIEGRINAGMFHHVHPEDGIRFFNHRGAVRCHVTDIKSYRSFTEMLTKEDFHKCLPEARTLEEASAVYDRIPGYKERAAQFGVLALHLAVDDPKPMQSPAAASNIDRKRARE